MLYAGFWKRVAACIIDQFIVMVIAILAGSVMGLISAVIFQSMPEQQLMAMMDNAGNILGVIVCWLYYALQESSDRKATLGKHFMCIQVTDYNMKQITFGKATWRFFSKYVSMFIFFIGYMMAGWTQRKQALHDMMAKTYVINRVDDLEIEIL